MREREFVYFEFASCICLNCRRRRRRHSRFHEFMLFTFTYFTIFTHTYMKYDEIYVYCV